MKVIQTFLSEEKSEQVQIMGRTARQNQGGFFQIILLQDELVRKFGVTDAEIATKQAKGTGMYDFLDAKRCEHCDTSAQRRRREVKEAKAEAASCTGGGSRSSGSSTTGRDYTNFSVE